MVRKMSIKYKISPHLYRLLREIKLGKRNKNEQRLISKVEKYKNIHDGERCFIIGNGPSIKNVNLSYLSNEYTFTVNQLPRSDEFKYLKTTYHIWSDRTFFEISAESPEDIELLNVMKKVNDGNNNPIVFYEITALPMIKKYNLEKDLNVEYFKSIGLDLNIMLKKRVDFTRAIPNMPTVVQSAILLAVYMGFKKIYLLGCDCTGIVNIVKNKVAQGNEMVYGYAISEGDRKRMEKMAKQRSIKDELMSQAAMFEIYELLYEYCCKNEVELYNATQGGILDCIPRVGLEDII